MMEVTINELFNQISAYLKSDPEHTLQGMLPTLEAGSVVAYNNFIKYDTTTYHRHLVYQNQWVDAYILTWLPGQGSRFHGHPTRGCIYRVLQGKLTEDRMVDGVIYNKTMAPGQCNYIDNSVGIHKVSNRHEVPVISLHFYSPSGYYQSKVTKSSALTDIESDHQKQDSDSQNQNQNKD
jgi:hypothetical protein